MPSRSLDRLCCRRRRVRLSFRRHLVGPPEFRRSSQATQRYRHRLADSFTHEPSHAGCRPRCDHRSATSATLSPALRPLHRLRLSVHCQLRSNLLRQRTLRRLPIPPRSSIGLRPRLAPRLSAPSAVAGYVHADCHLVTAFLYSDTSSVSGRRYRRRAAYFQPCLRTRRGPSLVGSTCQHFASCFTLSAAFWLSLQTHLFCAPTPVSTVPSPSDRDSAEPL